jgi:hypothetical protein
MRITEKDLRRLVREMALKSYTVLPGEENLGGEDIPLGVDLEDPREEEVFYRPAKPEDRPAVQAYLDRTYRQPGYRRTVERQFGIIPFPLNVFVLPSVSEIFQGVNLSRGAEVERIGTRLENGMVDHNGRKTVLDLLERIQPGCTSVIDPGDATLIVQPAGIEEKMKGKSAEEIRVMPDIKRWREGDGVYMAIHALFENGGPYFDYAEPLDELLDDLADLLADAGYHMMEDDVAEKIIRVKTLRNYRAESLKMIQAGTAKPRDPERNRLSGHDTQQEICVVANLIGKAPINTNSFPTTSREGEPLDPALISAGNEKIQEIHDLAEESVGVALYPGMMTISTTAVEFLASLSV